MISRQKCVCKNVTEEKRDDVGSYPISLSLFCNFLSLSLHKRPMVLGSSSFSLFFFVVVFIIFWLCFFLCLPKKPDDNLGLFPCNCSSLSLSLFMFLSLAKKPDDIGVCFLVPGDHSENSSHYLLTSTHPLFLLTHTLSSNLLYHPL